MATTWQPQAAGVLVLPSGRAVRGRAIGARVDESSEPELGVYLSARSPLERAWDSRWIHWRDFRSPSDPALALDILREAWRRSEDQRVEVACRGGVGRTGTALACLAVIDGVPTGEAVALVRRDYHRRAVETPWQRRFVARLEPTWTST